MDRRVMGIAPVLGARSPRQTRQLAVQVVDLVRVECLAPEHLGPRRLEQSPRRAGRPPATRSSTRVAGMP